VARAPYPGLRPFEREEADVFFGRERHVDAMVDRLAHHRFLAVTGTSGSGKSSLVRAGLLEALEAGLLAKAGPRWRFAILRPGDHPMSALAAALLEAQGAATEPDDVALRRAALERGPLALIEELRDRPLPEGGNLLILIDQFEELFRYRGLAGREEAEAFVALLLASIAQADMPIYAVLTMRSDFFGECSQFEGLAEAVCDSLYLCPRLTREQIVATVELPARVFGGRVEPQLVARIVNDMGIDPDQLPLMQHAMMRLWDQTQGRGETPPVLRLDDYLAADGLKGSLSRHADEIVETLARAAPERREMVRRMFCLLTGRIDDRAVRRLAPVSEVMGATEQPLGEIAAIADAFRAPGANLLLPSLPQELTPETILDISHEALIRQWQTLNDWLADEREFMVWRGHVERDAGVGDGDPLTGQRLAVARGWFERRATVMPPVLRQFIADSIAADDRRIAAERRRRRTIFGTTAAGLVVAVILAGVAGWQWHVAETERAHAEREANTSKAAQAEAERQRTNAVWAASLAKAAQAEAEREKAAAQHSLDLATQTVNGLIFDVAYKYWDAGVPRSIIKDILDRTLKLQAQLAAGGQVSPELLYTQSVALEGNAEALLSVGDSDRALTEAKKARGIAQNLVKLKPDNVYYQLALSISTGEVGDVLEAQGNHAGALVAYQESQKIMEALAAKQPDKAEWQNDMLDRDYRIGDVLKALRRLPEALKAYEDGLKIAEALTKRDPNNPSWQRNLSICDDRIGDVYLSQGHRNKAIALFRASLKIRQMLVAKNPDNTQWQRDVALSDEKIADVLNQEGQTDAAVALYQDSLKIRRTLVAKDPSNTGWQHDLSVSEERIGDLLRAKDDLSGALAAYMDDLHTAKMLAKKDPGIAEWQRDVSISDYRVGGILEAQHKLPEALVYYRDALSIINTLEQKDPNDPQRLADLLYGLRRNAKAELAAKNAVQALTDQQQLLKLRREIFAAAPNDATKSALTDALGSTSYTLLFNRQWQQALDLAEEALKLDPSKVWIETNRAHALLFLGHYDEATTIYLADKDKPVGKGTFGQAVKDDFAMFRTFGIDTPDMKKIEALLG